MKNLFPPSNFLQNQPVKHLSGLLWIAILLFLAPVFLPAQNVAINDDNSNADPSAMLDVKSSTKGALFPRLTTAQRAILGNANPATGLLVFDSDTKTYWYWMDDAWVELATSNAATAVPVGSVFPYAGTINDDGSVLEPAPGYLLCNGAAISGLQYPALKNALMKSWGDGNDADDNTVNLPDLRGMFLRGASGPRSDGKEDPDKSSRIAMLPGGNTGDNVGSFQSDAFQGHWHNIAFYISDGGGSQLGAYIGNTNSFLQQTVQGPVTDGTNGSPRTSSETRPENAYVHYIIKY